MRNGAVRSALICASLAACATTPEGVYRDTAKPMGASTRFSATDFAGDWQIQSRFGSGPGGIFRVSEAAAPADMRIDAQGLASVSGLYRVGVPGELIPVNDGREALIVIWVDEDFETAAIGTASGSFGALIDRDGVVPPDRAQAARQILTFYGWDVSQLNEVQT